MSWDSKDLLSKAQLYIDRAYQNQEDSSIFALWMILSLELIARAAIANVHPVLLANPNRVPNLYYAIGRQDLCESPKSVSAKTVFDRCETLFHSFTRSEKDFCNALRGLRNAEIHSGESVLELIPVPNWQLNLFRVYELLLRTMDLEIDDVVPSEYSSTVQEMLQVNEDQEKSNVRKLISAAKVRTQTENMKLEDYRDSLRYIVPTNIDLIIENLRARCPVCEESGTVTLKRLAISDAKLMNEVPFRPVTYIPIGFSCQECKLALDSYARMVMAQMGDPIIAEVEIDVMDLFMEYMEPDYGNE